MTRLQLEEHIFRRSHFGEEGRGACHRSGSCQLLSAAVHSDVLVCFQQSNKNVMLIYFYAAVGNITHTGSMLSSHGCCTTYQIYKIQLNRSSLSLQMNTSS